MLEQVRVRVDVDRQQRRRVARRRKARGTSARSAAARPSPAGRRRDRRCPRAWTGVCPNTTTSGKPYVVSSPIAVRVGRPRRGSRSGRAATGSSAQPFVSIIHSTLSRCSIDRSGIGSSLTGPHCQSRECHTPRAQSSLMEPGSTLRFTAAARALADAARRLGLDIRPAFAARHGSARSIGRSAAIRAAPSSPCACGSRPWAAVLADMVEGVIAANDLTGQCCRLRARRAVAGGGRRRPIDVAQVA